jgi:hypothetical protein
MLKARFIPAHRAYETIDEFGRAGATIGYFEHDYKARAAAEGKGWYGGAGGVEPALLIEVDGRYYQVASHSMDGFPVDSLNTDLIQRRKDVRATAWDKIKAALTPDEINLLELEAPK